MKKWIKFAICAAAALAGGLFSVFSQLFLLPVIALAAYMGSEWGVGFEAPVLGAVAAGMLLFFGHDAALYITLAMYLLAAVALTVYGKKRLPHRYGLLGLAVILLLGNYLAITIEPMLSGQPPYARAVELWETSYLPAAAQTLSAESMQALESAGALIPEFLMFFCVLIAEASALALILLYRLCHRLFRTKPRPMARFCYWRLPKSALLFVIFSAAAAGLCYLLKLEQANSVALTMGLISSSLFAIQGLAFLSFVLEFSGAPKGLRWLLWGLSFFLLPYSMIFLSLVGIREHLKNRRGRIMNELKDRLKRSRAIQREEEYAKYGYIRDDEEEKNDDKDASDKGSDGE